MKLFGVLTVINYPHLMPDEHEALRRFLTERNLPAWDELNAMSRDERYQRARTLLEIDRALRSEIEH